MNIISGPVKQVRIKQSSEASGAYTKFEPVKTADINWVSSVFEAAIHDIQQNVGTGTMEIIFGDTGETFIAYLRARKHIEMDVEVTLLDDRVLELTNLYLTYEVNRPNGRDSESHKIVVRNRKQTPTDADYCPNPASV
jgi:hypothetical protein